jgi:predicted pyridoxine 5'-phosphate oxidase superfamily flavin-nucleotide-binding protein
VTIAYHEGERDVQARAGVQVEISRRNKMIHPAIPPQATTFLSGLSMVVVGSIDGRGQVWASMLTGRPGFLQAMNQATLRIQAVPVPGDPLNENLRIAAPVGIIAIEFASRRRMRINGRVVRLDDGLHIGAEQVYGNCPKYIQPRELSMEDAAPAQEPYATRGEVLTPDQRRWIEQANTFFIATYHEEGGADASHRGGNPGFVRVLNQQTLVWPDYPGNQMFQTLGNLVSYPNSGLLFIDFDDGRTLQLNGEARIRWEQDALASFPDAERLVEFRLQEVVETVGAHTLQARSLGSPRITL